jgi:hypothetical protein
MIKTIDTKIQKINATTTEILLKFEDTGLKLEQYIHLKYRLDTFKLYLNKDYILKSENRYDKNNGQLIIELTLLISDYLMPEEFKATDVSNEIIDLYKIFYDAQNKIYEKNYQNGSKSFKIK